jgi:long-chain acyl-CoA synthetase
MYQLDKSIYSNFLDTVRLRKDAPVIFYEGKTISYNSFLKIVRSFSAYYRKIGLKEGDLITLVAPNTPESVACFYAASQCGLSIHLLHPLTSQENILKEYEDKHSKLLVTISLFIRFYDKILARKIPILTVSPTDSLNGLKRFGFSLIAKKQLAAYKEHKKEFATYLKDVKPLKGDPDYVDYPSKRGRIILSSGGTTGVSKSIVLSDYAFLALLDNSMWIMEYTDRKQFFDKTMLAVLPMFHGFGLTMGVMALMLAGGRIALMPKFHTKPVVKLLKQKKLTYLIGVPAIYEALLKNKEFRGDLLKPLEQCWVGGDFISPSLLERFNKVLSESGSKGMLMEGYGLTETVTVLCVNRLKDHKDGTIGRPLPNVQVKILDEDHKEVRHGELGEIAITGETLMEGYMHEANPFYEIDGKKYVLSGDIGKVDDDGFVYFCSRKKRMIKKKGLNIYPLAIEKAVSSIDGVLECAYLGETYKGRDYTVLYVGVGEGHPFEETKKAILADLKLRFNKYELPDFVFLRENFPHTNVGKINYPDLAKNFHAYLGKNK